MLWPFRECWLDQWRSGIGRDGTGNPSDELFYLGWDLQFAQFDAPIKISCRSLGHGMKENELGGIEAGGCHLPELMHRSKHRAVCSGNGMEENKLRDWTETGGCHSFEWMHRSKHLVARSTNGRHIWILLGWSCSLLTLIWHMHLQALLILDTIVYPKLQLGHLIINQSV